MGDVVLMPTVFDMDWLLPSASTQIHTPTTHYLLLRCARLPSSELPFIYECSSYVPMNESCSLGCDACRPCWIGLASAAFHSTCFHTPGPGYQPPCLFYSPWLAFHLTRRLWQWTRSLRGQGIEVQYLPYVNLALCALLVGPTTSAGAKKRKRTILVCSIAEMIAVSTKEWRLNQRL